MMLSDCELYDLVAEQIELVQNICTEMGATLHHVKAHGALYNMAARDATMSYIIAGIIKEINPSLILYGLSNSFLISEAEALGLKTASEVFADRTYTPEGMLTPRTQANALLHSREESLSQVLQMITQQQVRATDGSLVSLKADTICIHGDGDHALSFAEAIFTAMKENNILIRTP